MSARLTCLLCILFGRSGTKEPEGPTHSVHKETLESPPQTGDVSNRVFLTYVCVLDARCAVIHSSVEAWGLFRRFVWDNVV